MKMDQTLAEASPKRESGAVSYYVSSHQLEANMSPEPATYTTPAPRKKNLISRRLLGPP